MKYELYENDKRVMTFEAEGHVWDIGFPDTISLYGCYPRTNQRSTNMFHP
jgi:hypothetical protein